MTNSYALEVTELAERDIAEILIFTQVRWGSEQRSQYKAQIDKCLQSIQKDPYPVLEADRATPGYFRRHLGGRSRHFIYYRISDMTIVVVRILYDAMKFESYLE